MTNAKEQCVSCLLLVSPVKVLAGVAVEDTLEFLLQLCVVCKSVDRDAKEAAAQEVMQKGDALLYKSSVNFRRGLILVQAVIRTFIRRRVGKRRAIEISARSHTGRLSMSVGTRFLKELPQGRIYDGVIRSVQNNRYTLTYDQDPEAEDEVGMYYTAGIFFFTSILFSGTNIFRVLTDEIEMKIILEESQRLVMYRDRISESGRRISKRHSKRSDDADISLTSLPDLSQGLAETPNILPATTAASNPSLLKRVSSRDSGIAMLTPKQKSPVLVRSMSQRQPSSPASNDLLDSEKRSDSHLRLQGTKSLNIENISAPSSSRVIPPKEKSTPENDHPPIKTNDLASGDGKTWQASLKKILDDGRQGEVVPLSGIGTTSSNNEDTPETQRKELPRKSKASRAVGAAR